MTHPGRAIEFNLIRRYISYTKTSTLPYIMLYLYCIAITKHNLLPLPTTLTYYPYLRPIPTTLTTISPVQRTRAIRLSISIYLYIYKELLFILYTSNFGLKTLNIPFTIYCVPPIINIIINIYLCHDWIKLKSFVNIGRVCFRLHYTCYSNSHE